MQVGLLIGGGVGGEETVGFPVGRAVVGLGENVGAAGVEGRIFTSAQLKKTSGQTDERSPELGYGGVHLDNPGVQYELGRVGLLLKYSEYPGGEHEFAVIYFH
mmetsp:Transcript_21018/g.43296  ORF Transcript_21018/g.43296 Transcript_21018/m.43296 type:complete len:103 (-) Transcript_21018:85-393(-)